MTKSKSASGFTLLEILIALAIFSLLAVLTSGALKQAFNTKSAVFRQMDETKSLQFLLALLSRDALQITARSVTGEEMRRFPPFIGQPTYMEFTRNVPVSSNLKLRQAPMARIGYLCEKKRLIRRSFLALDSLDRSKTQDEVLLNHLSTCRFAYISHVAQVLPVWRPGAVKQNQLPEYLPSGIELTLVHERWGKMVNRFLVPEALYADNQK